MYLGGSADGSLSNPKYLGPNHETLPGTTPKPSEDSNGNMVVTRATYTAHHSTARWRRSSAATPSSTGWTRAQGGGNTQTPHVLFAGSTPLFTAAVDMD